MTHVLMREDTSEDQSERARRAVKAFRALQPTLSAYARVLTRDQKVQVVMAAQSNGATDGKRIFYRPPIGLGDPTSHNRTLCDKRDGEMQLLCPACKIREQVLVVVYHEIAHIAFGTFAQPDFADLQKLVREATDGLDPVLAARVKDRIDATPYHRRSNFLQLAALFNEYLPTLYNALEDARINAAQFRARKGTKIMFDADTHRVFNEGVEQKDPATGEIIVKSWKEYPQNSQVLVGVFCKASGYDYHDWFIPPVVECLDDAQLGQLTNQLMTVRSAKGTYELSFPILRRLRELGFCCDPEVEVPEEPEPDDIPQPEGESDDEPSDQPGDGSDDDEPQSGDSGSDSEESGDDRSGDEDQPGEASSDGDSGAGDDSDGESADGESESGSEGTESDDGAASDDGDGDGGSADHSSDGGSVDEPADESSPTDGDSSERDEAGGSDPSETSRDGAGGDEAPDDQPDSEGDDDEGMGNASGGQGESSEGDAQSAGGEVDASPTEGPAEDSGPAEESDDGQVEGDRGGDEPGGSGADGAPGEPVPASSSVGEDDNLDDGDEAEDSDDLRDGRRDESGGRSDSGEVEPADSDGDPSSPESGDDVVAPVPEPAPEEREAEDSEPDAEPIDSGADEGHGGTLVHEHESWDDVPMGNGDDAEKAVKQWSLHGDKPEDIEETERGNEEAVDRAIIQGIYFETPSRNIYGVREHHYGVPVEVEGYNMSRAWDEYTASFGRVVGKEGEYDNTPESVLGGVLLKMRVAFSANKRGATIRHKKSGRIDAGSLGKRAWSGDDRLFKQKILPGKRDYFVLIGLDVSGSTLGTNIDLIKKAAFAQAELLNRMGIKFSIYAHSGNFHSPRSGRAQGIDLDIYIIKEADEPWIPNVQKRLKELGPDSANLDGHTLEYYRKRLDERGETDKIILYYTDGKMPAENHDEELEILQREIKVCRRKGYHLLGVGIRTDSPARHGLDTVQVDEVADLKKVIEQLGKYLAVTG